MLVGAVDAEGACVIVGKALGFLLTVGFIVGPYVGAIPGKHVYLLPFSCPKQQVLTAHSSTLSKYP